MHCRQATSANSPSTATLPASGQGVARRHLQAASPPALRQAALLALLQGVIRPLPGLVATAHPPIVLDQVAVGQSTARQATGLDLDQVHQQVGRQVGHQLAIGQATAHPAAGPNQVGHQVAIGQATALPLTGLLEAPVVGQAAALVLALLALVALRAAGQMSHPVNGQAMAQMQPVAFLVVVALLAVGQVVALLVIGQMSHPVNG